MSDFSRYIEELHNKYKEFLVDLEDKHKTALFVMGVLEEIVDVLGLEDGQYKVLGNFPSLEINTKDDAAHKIFLCVNPSAGNISIIRGSDAYEVSIYGSYLERIKEIVNVLNDAKISDGAPHQVFTEIALPYGPSANYTAQGYWGETMSWKG